MYVPRQIGIPAENRSNVVYEEHKPPAELAKLLFYTWELRTRSTLNEDFLYLILPDACSDIIFDLHAAGQGGQVFIMTSGSTVEEVNLGRQFHFTGLRFLPGVVRGNALADKRQLQRTWQRLRLAKDTYELHAELISFASSLLAEGKIAENYLMYHILSRSDRLRRVEDIERLSGYTRRQLQRIFKAQTGLTPHDFLSVLRFQHAITDYHATQYADQSHLIKEFKRITDLTPGAFKAKY